MSYAQIQSGQPIELTGGTLTSGDVQFSYETMQLWSDDERKTCDIYTITDDVIPSSKVATGSTLEFSDGTMRRVWMLEDAPPPSVPDSVSPSQARLALLAAGKLAAVKTAVASADDATQIWFEYATVWERNNPILMSLGSALGLSSDDIDNLFKQASAI